MKDFQVLKFGVGLISLGGMEKSMHAVCDDTHYGQKDSVSRRIYSSFKCLDLWPRDTSIAQLDTYEKQSCDYDSFCLCLSLRLPSFQNQDTMSPSIMSKAQEPFIVDETALCLLRHGSSGL